MSAMTPFERMDRLMVEVHGPDGHLTAVCEEIIYLLYKSGLATWDVDTPPEDNGESVDSLPDECIRVDFLPALAAQIVRAGFLWSACCDAVCMQDDDLQMKLHSQSSYNPLRFVAAHSSVCDDKDTMTDPMDQIDNLMTEATKCVRGKQQGQVVALCEQIIAMLLQVGMALSNVELKDAMEKGLVWTVIKAAAWKRLPELPKIIQ